MKKLLFFFFFISILQSGVSGQQVKNFVLQGVVSMRDTGMLYLMYWTEGNKVLDSAAIKNGKFIFTGFISEPVMASLSDGKKMYLGYKNLYTDFYIVPNKMKISLVNDHFADAQLTGSKTNNEFRLLNRKILPVYHTINALKNKIREDSFSNRNRFDSLRLYSAKVKNILLTFIKEYPNSIVAAKAIGYLGALGINKDSITGMLDALPVGIKNGYFVHWLKEYEQKQEPDSSAVGNKAPGFSKKDKNGTEISLAGFKGKYILLDFWASWCIPCRGLMPDVKEWFGKYHSKGLEIISVSSWEKDSTAWEKAIDKDKVNDWYQVLDVALNTKYHVQPITDFILINREGIIIGRYVGDTEIKVKLGRKLSEIFDG